MEYSYDTSTATRTTLYRYCTLISKFAAFQQFIMKPPRGAYPPAMGCDSQLDALCNATCSSWYSRPLHARVDRSAVDSDPIAWRCYSRSTLSSDGCQWVSGSEYCAAHDKLLALLQTCVSSRHVATKRLQSRLVTAAQRGEHHRLSGFGSPLNSSCPTSGMTSDVSRHDGFGAQFYRMLTVVGEVRQLGSKYCTREWQGVEHVQPGAASRLFRFVGGHLYGPPASTATQQRGGASSWLAFHPTTRNMARRRYYAIPKPTPHLYNTSRRIVAIHVRRGDAMGEPLRYVPDEHYIECARHLAHEIGATHLASAIHVFTDGNLSTIEPILRAVRTAVQPTTSLEVHTNASGLDVTTVFHHLVVADVLILSKSSFSASAAALSLGELVYLDRYPPLGKALDLVHSMPCSQYRAARKAFANDWNCEQHGSNDEAKCERLRTPQAGGEVSKRTKSASSIANGNTKSVISTTAAALCLTLSVNGTSGSQSDLHTLSAASQRSVTLVGV